PRSNLWGDDEPDFAALEFFVELERFQDFFPRNLGRQLRRKLKFFQKIDNRVPVVLREPGFPGKDFTGRDHSESDRFSVRNFLVISGALDRVPDRVTEV